MMATRFPEHGSRAEWLADAELRSAVERYVRRRLAGDEAADIVQATVADALASDNVPGDQEGFRRFVFAVARNKVADHYRRHLACVAIYGSAGLSSSPRLGPWAWCSRSGTTPYARTPR